MESKKRLKEESETDFAFRICAAHSEIGTWRDVADLLNGELGTNRSPKTWKNLYNSWKFMNRSADGASAGTEKFEQLLRDIRREKTQLTALKRDLLRAERENDRRSLFYDQLLDAVEPYSPPPASPLYGVDYIRVTNRGYVLAFGDIHYGAAYEAKGNVYNTTVCEERFNRMYDEVACLVRDKGIDALSVVNVGDTIQGLLRLKDLTLNETTVVNAVVEVSRLIAHFLYRLSQMVRVDYYPVPSANHTQTRPLGTKANELSSEDVEQIIIFYVADLLRDNPCINVHIPDDGDTVSFEVGGNKILALHGHQCRSTSPGDIAKSYSARDGVFYDTIIMGHTHAAEERVVDGRDGKDVEVLVVPSFCGTDPYGASLLKTNCPAARLYCYDPEHGHIATEKIMLDQGA